MQLDGERVVAIVEKPPPGSTATELVAAPLYWLPRAVDRYLSWSAAQGGERYVSVARCRLHARRRVSPRFACASRSK